MNIINQADIAARGLLRLNSIMIMTGIDANYPLSKTIWYLYIY